MSELVELLEALNPPQREAVQHTEGPLLILAGPGSGKTRVITHRIAWLLEKGVSGKQILALTFTNKAAEEIQSRVEVRCPGHGVFLGTFHRFCARLLRRQAALVGLEPNFSIYDTQDSRAVLRRAIDSLEREITTASPEAIGACISRAKNNLVLPENFEPTPAEPVSYLAKELYPLYQQRLLSTNAADFDDLLLHVVRLLRENEEIRADLDHRYRYVMVDEYQDTNLAQYLIVRAISRDYPNLAVCGDPDQSIYGWRGAKVQNILNFAGDYPQVCVVRLEQNYRSTQYILSAAELLISYNTRRKEKRLFTDKQFGRPVRLTEYLDETKEAEAIAGRIAAEVRGGRRRPRDFSVLYRVNALSRVLETAMRGVGIPYRLVNSVEFFQRAEIKDLVAYMSLLNNPRNDTAFLRVVNNPTRGIGAATVAKLQDLAAVQGCSLWEQARMGHESLSAMARGRLNKFAAMMDSLAGIAHEPAGHVLAAILEVTRYREQYLGSHDEPDVERVANIDQLVSDAHQHGGDLESFLENACLVNDTDAWEADDDRVLMMTLHAAKGLEFPVVFIVGLEEGLLPHERSQESHEELEEERRLLFVGMTRAKEELNLSFARRRSLHGGTRRAVPSSFLNELPKEQLQVELLPVEQHDGVDPPRRPRTGAELAAQRGAAGAGAGGGGGGGGSGELRLMTAAQMESKSYGASGGVAGENGTDGSAATEDSTANGGPRFPPEAFQQWMAVVHPQYGPGKITELSGEGIKRRATVMFPMMNESLTFVLAYCPLRPMAAK